MTSKRSQSAQQNDADQMCRSDRVVGVPEGVIGTASTLQELPDSTPAHVSEISQFLGGTAVLLPVAPGEKGCRLPEWNRVTLASMRDPQFMSLFCPTGGVSVLVGEPSSGLISIDFDDDDAADEFFEINPDLTTSFRTKGVRGCNVWLQMVSDFPNLQNVLHRSQKDKDGRRLRVAEWRSTGGQTTIYGVHPTGAHYQWLVPNPPTEVSFDEIKWPSEWVPPQFRPTMSSTTSDATLAQTVWNKSGDINGGWIDGMIVLPSGYVSLTEFSEKASLRIAETRTLFVRCGKVVEIVADRTGARSLSLVTAQGMRSRLEHFGPCVAWVPSKVGNFAIVPRVPSKDLCSAFLETPAIREVLPQIRTVVNSPVLTQDNGIVRIVSEGYDDETGIFVAQGGVPPKVPIFEAVQRIKELMRDFRFVSPADQSRAIAALIGPALKLGGLLGAKLPIDVAEADCSQSGKTYRHKLNAAVYNETPSLVTQRDRGVGGDDEALNEALLRGKPFIQFDNRRGRWDSKHLEALMTASGAFPIRVPYQGTTYIDADNYFIAMSSNGVEMTPDLANRSLITRIRKQPRGYEFRTYDEGDVLDHVKARQPYYLGCVFAVATSWVDAGRPKTAESRHDFRE